MLLYCGNKHAFALQVTVRHGSNSSRNLEVEGEAETMEEGCLLAHCPGLLSPGPPAWKEHTHTGWTLLHQLAIKKTQHRLPLPRCQLIAKISSHTACLLAPRVPCSSESQHKGQLYQVASPIPSPTPFFVWSFGLFFKVHSCCCRYF